MEFMVVLQIYLNDGVYITVISSFYELGNFDDSMYQYKSVFLQAVYKMILGGTHLSRLRIQKLDLHVFPEAAYVTGVLLEAPPAICK